LPRPISNKIIYIGGLVDDHTSVGNKILEPVIIQNKTSSLQVPLIFPENPKNNG